MLLLYLFVVFEFDLVLLRHVVVVIVIPKALIVVGVSSLVVFDVWCSLVFVVSRCAWCADDCGLCCGGRCCRGCGGGRSRCCLALGCGRSRRGGRGRCRGCCCGRIPDRYRGCRSVHRPYSLPS